MIICPTIEYAFYAAPFLVPSIHKLDKLLIRLKNIICNIPKDSPSLLTQLPRDIFGIKGFSLLPRYATTCSEQLTQIFIDLGPLGQIY